MPSLGVNSLLVQTQDSKTGFFGLKLSTFPYANDVIFVQKMIYT